MSMRAPRWVFALSMLAASAQAAPPAAQPTPAAPKDVPMTDAQVTAALRQQLASQTGDAAFSGAVLLAKGDRILFREAYGLASRETKVPNRPDTRFNLGSINKVFTRLAVEQLAAAGTLHLTDTLDRWVPEYPVEKARQITLQQLIDHRAGTGDFFGPRFEAADHSRLRTLRDWLPLIADLPLAFEPGTRQEYSNAGYLLLGLVIEKASGQSYFDYVRDHIFARAGMAATASHAVDEDVANRATGYTRRRADTLTDNHDTLPARGSSAGGGYSTLDDLLAFAQAMRDGRLGRGAGGLGVAGGAPGVNAVFEMEGDYTTIVLANLDPPAAQKVAEAVRDLLQRAHPELAARHRGERRVRVGGGDLGPGLLELPPGGVEVPMLRSGALPAVQVMVNGKGPFVFEIDTGAAGTARLDAALVETLGLPRKGEIKSGDPSGQNARPVPLVGVSSIEIGGARFGDVTASVRERSAPGAAAVDGVLGIGLFARCLLTLDYPGARVGVSGGELPAANGQDVLDFRDADGIPSVTLRVAGREMEAHVDSGSMGGIVLPEAAALGLPLAEAPRVVGHARTESNAFDIKAAPLAGDVTIGGLTFARPTVELQPLFPTASIGARILRDLVLTIDSRNHRLRLLRPTPAAAPVP